MHVPRSDTAPFRTCIFHIGLEKIGSTSIQTFLTAHADPLHRMGFFVSFSLARSDGFCNHLRLPAHALDHDRIDDDVREHYGVTSRQALDAFRLATPRLLEREIRARGGAPVLLLSNGHLSSRLDRADELVRLRDLLDPFCGEFRIIAFLRNQADVLESIYGEAIKDGRCDIALPPDFSENGNGWIDRGYFEYDHVLERRAATFGADRVEVRLFNRDALRGNDVVADFLCHIGIDPSRFGKLPRVNHRLDVRAQAFLLRINQALPSDEATRIRDTVVDVLSAASRGPGRQLSGPETLHFMALFADNNERVRERWFPSSPALFQSTRPRDPSGPVDAEAALADAADLTTLLLRRLISGV